MPCPGKNKLLLSGAPRATMPPDAPHMNIHHLELFYYVAKFGGISEAVRNMPYGIQQPAMSGQVIQLEEFLGTTLFQRRPFQLTTEGKELYDFICPFFDNLDTVATRLRGGEGQIRIGSRFLQAPRARAADPARVRPLCPPAVDR